MISFKKSLLLKVLVMASVSLGGSTLGAKAFAQSSMDMSLLTEQERQHYTRLLEDSEISAGRAKITAEINRIVQERRLKMRQNKDKSKQQDANPQRGSAPQ